MKSPPSSRFGVARVLSKRGLASRTEAAGWVREGRVRVDGRCTFDPEFPTRMDADIQVDGVRAQTADRIYLALNKPRGLVTTARDEKQRATIYDCLRDLQLPWIAPVGRLDQASEGLLLLSNDSQWAAGITAPESRLCKTYHVQIDRPPSTSDLQALVTGVEVEAGQPKWCAVSANLLRSGGKTAWLEVALDEGRNRQIRRMLMALDLRVLRLLRVAIGPVLLGNLAKGATRTLSADEIAALRVTHPDER